MKVKELIAALQKEDPTGELEVCDDGNHDIYFLETQEAYYDGNLQRLIIDESKRPYYCVAGAKVVSSGCKVRLHTMGVEDVISNDPDAFIDLSNLEKNSPVAFERWKKLVEDWRQEVRQILAEIDAEQKKEKE